MRLFDFRSNRVLDIVVDERVPVSQPPAGRYYPDYSHLAAGLCCGLSSLAAGLAIGITGDAGVRANAHQSEIFVGMLLMLIFAEALGLYGLIISLILSQ